MLEWWITEQKIWQVWYNSLSLSIQKKCKYNVWKRDFLYSKSLQSMIFSSPTKIYFKTLHIYSTQTAHLSTSNWLSTPCPLTIILDIICDIQPNAISRSSNSALQWLTYVFLTRAPLLFLRDAHTRVSLGSQSWPVETRLSPPPTAAHGSTLKAQAESDPSWIRWQPSPRRLGPEAGVASHTGPAERCGHRVSASTIMFTCLHQLDLSPFALLYIWAAGNQAIAVRFD